MTYDEMIQWDDDQALQDYLDGELSAAEVLTLEKRLCLEPDLADRLIEIACDDSVLAEWGAPEIFGKRSLPFKPFRFGIPSLKSFSLRKLSGTTVLLTVMALFWSSLIFIGTHFYFSHQGTQKNTKQPEVVIVKKEEQKTITEGTVELLLPTGVKVIIAAPATFQITGRNEMTLSHGMLIANVTTEAGKGFTVKTPRGRVVDLGTIFGVEVDASGTSSVQVFKGKVDVISSSGVIIPLSAGSTVRCQAGEEQWRKSEKLSKEFYTVLEKQTLLPEIIPVGDVGVGIVGDDFYSGISYVMYSVTPLKERFKLFQPKISPPRPVAEHFVVVNFKKSSQTWQLQCNQVRLDFTPVSSDLLIAISKANPADKSKRDITRFEGKYGVLHGISHGYQTSDITIRSNWFDGEDDEGGEITLSGTYLIREQK